MHVITLPEDVGAAIGPVQLVQVDVVGLESLERQVDRGADVFARSACSVVRERAFVFRVAELWREGDFVAATSDDVPYQPTFIPRMINWTLQCVCGGTSRVCAWAATAI